MSGWKKKGVERRCRGDTLNLGAAQQLGARKSGAVVTCVGKVDRGWVLDRGEEGKRDDIDRCIWVY